MLGQAPWRLRDGTFVPGESCIEEVGGGGERKPTVCGLTGAQVHRQAFIFAQVGLGKNAAKALSLPEECACPGLTGLPKNGRQRVSYIGLVRNRNNPPFTQTLKQTKTGASHCPPGLDPRQEFGFIFFLD